MIEDLTTRIIVFVIASGILGWGAYETFFNHEYVYYIKRKNITREHSKK